MVIVTLQEGRRAIPLDIRFDKDCPGMNLLTNEGFATALYHCSTMAPGSSATLAPVCSTFVAVFPSKIQYPKWNFFTETKLMCFVWGLFFHRLTTNRPRSCGSTFRTRANPEGRPDSKAVYEGNVLAWRTLLICLLCASRGIWFVLEQPHSSVMEYHPCFQFLCRLLTIHRFSMKMLDYGSPTQKRTVLYSSPSSFKWKLFSTNMIFCF